MGGRRCSATADRQGRWKQLQRNTRKRFSTGNFPGDSQQAFRMNVNLQIVPPWLPKVRGVQPSPCLNRMQKSPAERQTYGIEKKIMKAAFCRKESLSRVPSWQECHTFQGIHVRGSSSRWNTARNHNGEKNGAVSATHVWILYVLKLRAYCFL